MALALGWSESLTHKKLYGDQSLPRQSARVVEALLRYGYTDDVALFLAPSDAARQGEVTGQLVEALLSAAIADCHEDTKEARYNANPCRETAKELYDATVIEIARQAERNAELRAKWGL